MNQRASKEVSSFQQRVSVVEQKNGTQIYSKKIVSNYSWWTFDDTDIFQRELISYKLLTAVKLVPALLEVDQANKQFTVEAVATVKPKAEQIQHFLISLIDLLTELRRFPAPELQTCSCQHLMNLYSQKGQAAQVNRRLLEEIRDLLSKWAKNETHPLSYVHGDLHFGNLLYDGETIRLIDFEEAIQSHPVFDATSLSWDILDQFGEKNYAHFRSLYYQQFNTDLIDLAEWKRFCKLRDWIVGRYLDQCCSQKVKKQANRFIVDTEPTAVI